MSSPSNPHITSVLKETRILPAAGGFAARRTSRAWPNTSSSGSGPRTIRKASGPSRPNRCTGSSAGTRCSTWNEPHAQVVRRRQDQRQLQLPRSPSRRPAQQQGRHHLGRRAGRHPRADLSGSAPRSLQVRQRPEGPRHQDRRPRHHLHADDSRSWRSPCWPAPASGRRTASSSAASAPRPSPTATTTPRRSSSSPPTAAGGAARSCRSRRTSMQALDEVADRREVHRLQPLQSAGRHEAGPRSLVARADGRRLAPTAPPSRSTASIRSSSSTPAARPANPRACCTRRPATCSACR